MNRDTVSGTKTYARTPVEEAPGRSLRAARSRTRRRLHEPRPAATPEVRARVGQWKAEVKAACLAGHISKGGDKYLHELLTIPSVARGDYSLYGDTEMGRRINVSARTVRRHRADALEHGLVEVLGHGTDRKPCMVRPILRDGSPVFGRPEMAGKTDTYGRLTRPIVAADLLLTEVLETEEPPPSPSAAPDTAEEGRAAFENQVADPLQAPTARPGPKAAADDAISEIAEATPAAPTGPPGLSAAPSAAMSFGEFWLAMGRTGPEGYARAYWGRLSASDKAAIRARLAQPRTWAADMWAGKWLECRVWEEAAAANRPAQVWVREGSPEWRAWVKHGHSRTKMDSRGGWHFPSRLPPLDAEAATRK
jgi:hypothetical protein